MPHLLQKQCRPRSDFARGARSSAFPVSGFRLLGLTLGILALWTLPASSARLKDVASIKGVRSNQIIGYGLVVGLQGTGDRNGTRFTTQSLRSMLAKMGISLDPNAISTANVAAVMVTAKLPPFARSGSKIDAVISSVGDSPSLEGGTLLMTPLRGNDGEIYAIAQGPIAVGGFSAEGGGSSVAQNHPTVGNLVGGALVEREVPYSIANKNHFEIALHAPDFTTAQRTAESINKTFAAPVARARDSGTLDVKLPDVFIGDVVGFLAQVETVDIEPDGVARIILNERTGTIVMGAQVSISTVAVSHGNLTVVVNRTNQVSQPAPFSEGETTRLQNTEIEAFEEKANLNILEKSVTIGDLVQGLNAMGTTPTDLISIIQAIKASGALSADVEMM